MADPYEVDIGGHIYQVAADTPEQAAVLGRLYAAREQSVSQAEAGAVERSNARTPGQGFLENLGRQGTFAQAPTPNEARAEWEANIPEVAAAGAALPLLAANPVALAKGLALSAAGTGVGGLVGKEVIGRGLEAAGLPPGTAHATGVAGGLVGGFAGPAVGAKALLGLAESTGARGALVPILRKMFPEAVSGAASGAETSVVKAAQEKAAAEAEKMALRKRALDVAERRVAAAERKLALLEGGKAGPLRMPPTGAAAAPVAETAPAVATPSSVAVPASTGVPVPAADTATIVLKLQQQMKTASGRRIVNELLSQMPNDQAAEIRGLLARGQEHPATVLGALFNPSAPGPAVSGPGEELARLLGQIP